MMKLLAVDLDGTCLDHEDILRPSVLAALQRAADAGVTVAVATGRNLLGIPAALRESGFVRWCITSNGAAIFDLESGAAVEERSIPVETAAMLLSTIRAMGYPTSVTVGPDVIDCDRAVYDIRHSFFHDYAESLFADDLAAYVRARGEDPAKVHVLYLRRLDGTPVQALLETVPGITFTGRVKGHHEIVAAGVDKGAALLRLCHRLGVAPEACAAIGDSENDLTMLRAAGLSVAMGNAPDTIRAAARFTTSDCDHDGVPEAVEMLLGL